MTTDKWYNLSWEKKGGGFLIELTPFSWGLSFGANGFCVGPLVIAWYRSK